MAKLFTKQNHFKFITGVSAVALAACFSGCQKDNPTPPTSANVYVAGRVVEWYHAGYWKNGTKETLTKEQNGQNNFLLELNVVTAITVSGNDVYMASIHGYWKNGTVVIHKDIYGPDDYFYPTSIMVSGNDVYMAGYHPGQDAIVYTKNGTDDISIQGSSAGRRDFFDSPSIAVSGSDIYVAGSSIAGGGGATYWKNGSAVSLKDGSNITFANSIAATGTDVYVAGFTSTNGQMSGPSKAVYWKNGEIVNLTDGSTNAVATSITLSGNDIYVAGYEGTSAKYWKNGSPVTLQGLNGAQVYPQNNHFSIGVSGNDVYVAGGTSYGGSHSDNGVPSYWKNGTPVILNHANTFRLDTPMIAVSGTDVYLAASVIPNSVPTYWKDGVAIALTDGSNDAYANSIAVSGPDVYITNANNPYFPVSQNHIPTPVVYWKNGTSVTLSGDGQANSIAVSGNDVYVAGTEFSDNKYVGKYWKNGTAVSLTDGSTSSTATSIAVSGMDVYAAGSEGGIGKYWKNGTAVGLSGNGVATIYAIAVTGNDIYIAGTTSGNSGNNIATYWKNGIAVNLTEGPYNAGATAIAVTGNDVYVVGGASDGTNWIAKYWKNGTAVNLADGTNTSYATSIAVSGNDVYVAGYSGGSGGDYWMNGIGVALPNSAGYTIQTTCIFAAK